jgi:NADPH-dependent ferric siderophore reductase
MHIGRVESVERLTPHLVRIVLGGPGLADVEPLDHTDAYVNIALPRPGAAPDDPPARRRYTVRAWDPVERRLTIDFVVHGDAGVAGPWAARARVGDELAFTGPSGAYRPDSTADWHLLAGDESALPAIAASLAAIPEGRPTVVCLVCAGPDDEVALESPGRLDVHWLHRTGDPDRDVLLLAGAIRELELPAGRGHAFVHGEAAEVREVRRHLLAERGVAKADLSASPYWRRQLDDEAWRQVKASWNAEVERDVP